MQAVTHAGHMGDVCVATSNAITSLFCIPTGQATAPCLCEGVCTHMRDVEAQLAEAEARAAAYEPSESAALAQAQHQIEGLLQQLEEQQV